METLQIKIMKILQRVQNMDKDNTLGIVGSLKTEKQAQEFLQWLKTQPLEQMKRTQVIDKLEEIMKQVKILI